MLSGGDEVGRSQGGNNNAYCQDSSISWTRWDAGPDETAFLEFVRRLLEVWKTQPVLRRRTFLSGRRAGTTDVLWLRPNGHEHTEADWADSTRAALAMLLEGNAVLEPDAHGRTVVGDTLLVVFNGSNGGVEFALPVRSGGSAWTRLIDTADADGPSVAVPSGGNVLAASRSVSIWRTDGGRLGLSGRLPV
jgi:glycogen operon protein